MRESRRRALRSLSLAQTLRGVKFNVGILEEAGFMNEEVVLKVIMPVYQEGDSTLLAISTPPDNPTHFYQRFLEQEDENGKPYFTVIRLSSCAACQKAGTLLSCPHVGATPPWQSRSKKRSIAAVVGEGTALQELEGQLVHASTFYDPRLLDRFRRHEPVATYFEPRIVTIAVDPGNGSSQTAVAALAWDDAARPHLVGIDAQVTNDFTVEAFVATFVAAVAALPMLRLATLVVLVEANMGLYPAKLSEAAKQALGPGQAGRVVPIVEGGHGGVGMVKDNARTIRMHEMLRDAAQTGKLVRHAECVSPSPYPRRGHRDEESKASMGWTAAAARFAQLCEQMGRVTSIGDDEGWGPSGHGRKRRTIHGKLGGRNDDMVIAAAWAVYAHHVVYTFPAYERWR
jgi:hypothetical protein